MTRSEIYTTLVMIAADYDIYQCEACADAIQHWLIRHGLPGIRLLLRTRGYDFMISERVGGHMSITQNGCHYGIEVLGWVFDNLPQTGIPKQAWLDDFDSIDGFDVYESSF